MKLKKTDLTRIESHDHMIDSLISYHRGNSHRVTLVLFRYTYSRPYTAFVVQFVIQSNGPPYEHCTLRKQLLRILNQ